jgi:hypothetical protein
MPGGPEGVSVFLNDRNDGNDGNYGNDGNHGNDGNYGNDGNHGNDANQRQRNRPVAIVMYGLGMI